MKELEEKLQCKCNHCHEENPRKKRDEQTIFKMRLVRTAIATIFFAAGLLFSKKLDNNDLTIFKQAIFFIAYCLAGGPVLWTALKNILAGKVFNEYFLMAIATIGAIFINQLAEAVGVMIFFTLGELLQDLAVNKSRRSIMELLNIRPDFARILKEGSFAIVDPESVEVGQKILVQPGEKIPLDGQIFEGSSFVDTSALTGESVPRRVEVGDEILSGMINGSGLLKIHVSKKYSESSLAKIMHLIEEAAERKAPTEKFISKFAAWYTPFVVISAFLVALLPPLLIPGASFSNWLYRALVLLVISCPCALVLSIPLGYFGGIGGASRHGILVKGANILDDLTSIDTVVLDKTGTLTEGVFQVQEIVPRNGFSREEVLYWAAQAETFSSHPIAESIRQANNALSNQEQITAYEEIKGHGIKATINKKSIVLGNYRLLTNENISFEKDKNPHTIVYLAIDGTWAGNIIIADKIKDSAQEAIASLRKLNIENIFMLTGDRQPTASSIAQQLKLDGYQAELLPEDKVEFVSQQQDTRKKEVLFAGDGFNDAPVLMHAKVGLAMGALGTDAAIEAADVVLMDDDPRKIAKAIEISQFTKTIVKQNIIFSLAVKGIVAITGTLGLATMWWAVFADVGVALLAILNSTRTLIFTKPVKKQTSLISNTMEIEEVSY